MDHARQMERTSSVIAALRRRLESRELSGLEITYEIVPGLRRDHDANRVVLRPGGRSVLMRASPTAAGRVPTSEVALELKDKDVESLIASLAAVIGDLTPRWRGEFLPDSEMAMVTLTVDGRREDFFYLANADDRRIQGKPVSERALRALEHFRLMLKP